MIRKQDLLSALADLPDEVEPSEVIEALFQLDARTHAGYSQDQVDEFDRRVKKALERGGLSLHTYRARMDEWREKLLLREKLS
ncbi:MAG: hypothetical protein KDB07_03890 [Planctomycetes bacterium]|nr:hypothetical protein [Planctomycetota bacterium]